MSVSFSQSCPKKRQELSNSPFEEKQGYDYSIYCGNNCNFTVEKWQHPLSHPVAQTDNRKVSVRNFFFLLQVSPKVPDSRLDSFHPIQENSQQTNLSEHVIHFNLQAWMKRFCRVAVLLKINEPNLQN